MKKILSILILIAPLGCQSVTAVTRESLDKRHPDYHTEDCRWAINETEIHDDIKIGRMIVSPIIVLASGGLALPYILAGNAGIDYVDRSDANAVNSYCGGKVITEQEIMNDVLKGVAFSAVTSAVTPGPVQPATQTTK